MSHDLGHVSTQMLIGLCGAELVPKSAVGASQGVLGLVAYMGAANAGIPLAYVLKHHGWEVRVFDAPDHVTRPREGVFTDGSLYLLGWSILFS